MLVRDMELADCEAVAEIHVKAWQKVYPGIMPQDFLDQLDISKRTEAWRAGMEKDPSLIRLVVEESNHVIGFCVGLHNRTPHLVPEAVGEIWAIYLDPNYWGQGAGKLLLESFRERLQSSFCIWVARENKIGHRFYQKTGGKLLAATKDEDIAGTKIPHQVYLYS